jgi:hypothetical protein
MQPVAASCLDPLPNLRDPQTCQETAAGTMNPLRNAQIWQKVACEGRAKHLPAIRNVFLEHL